jgi:hypothetical protein
MTHSLGLAIESLVAVLLMLTIGYCMLLNSRLKRLKADESSLKATIAELITATEIAERAIGGLKHTVRDVNENLGNQLTSASKIVLAARPSSEPEPEPQPAVTHVSSAKAIAAAARAFSDRRRSDGLAA